MVRPLARPDCPHDHGASAVVAPSRLDAPITALLDAPALRGAVRATFDAEVRACAVDWPRLLACAELDHWLRPSDVLVELAHVPQREPFELAVVLHAESAVTLIERALGGAHASALPGAAGTPSEAECGVLAYVAARMVSALGAPLVVRDVRVDARPLGGVLPRVVAWPLALHASFGTIAGVLLLSPSLAASLERRFRVEVVVRDALAPDVALALTPGEAWVSDSWSLTDTTEGLFGPVLLATEGAETALAARLAGARMSVTGVRPRTTTGEVELVLASLDLSLTALAELASGMPSPAPLVGRSPALLRREGEKLAEGEAILHRGALGIRITRSL